VTIVEADDGLLVDSVQPGGAADRAGIQSGDLLLSVGEWKWDKEGTRLADYLATAEPAPMATRIERFGDTVVLEAAPDPALVATAREIERRIKRNRLFRRSAGEQLASLGGDLVAAVRSTETREAAYSAMNDVIDRCDLSHTAVMTPWVVENLFGDGEHYHLGMFVQAVESDGESRHFVRSLMHGSPARSAGLRIGDEIVSVNGVRFDRSSRRTLAGFEARRRMSAIQVQKDESVTIEFRRREGGEIAEVEITADQPLDAVSSARRSVRLMKQSGGATIGYVHFWNVMSEDNIELLKDALDGRFQAADALAIDLRGRGGQVGVINALAKILAREKRPVALLIDREARSAKEMLAHRLKGNAGITVVGETTAGAVLPASFHDLPGGAKLMLPVPIGDVGIRLFTRGDRLEGVGAIPDIRVDAPLPYRAGTDPILDRAVSLLRKQADEALVRL
jgi:C-terminal processing protease CtpA/Prc